DLRPYTTLLANVFLQFLCGVTVEALRAFRQDDDGLGAPVPDHVRLRRSMSTQGKANSQSDDRTHSESELAHNDSSIIPVRTVVCHFFLLVPRVHCLANLSPATPARV